jgi:3-oxoacyl-[acyl-carrier-protein] synthase-3
MAFNQEVYINAISKYLPGQPVSNDEMEEYLGAINGKPSKARLRILKQNGIKSRYYAIDKEQRTTHLNSELASNAVLELLKTSGVNPQSVDYLAAATTQGDILVPGFASMVHANLPLPACETASFGGVCASGMVGLKTSYLQVASGLKQNAVCCASELVSRLFKSQRYEDQKTDGKLSFDTEFLRWMLSDGAGAMLLQPTPLDGGLSLKIEWIEIKSHANHYDVCMYAGSNREKSEFKSWFDYPNFTQAGQDGAMNLKQDIRMLDEIVKVSVYDLFDLIDKNYLKPSDIDWAVFHYSSHFFRSKAMDLLKAGGVDIPEEKWFTNLHSKGNTGSASIFIMLEELFNEGKLKPGQKILCMVPESGRFMTAFMYLTVVGDQLSKNELLEDVKHFEAPEQSDEWLIRQLTKVWIDFERRLNKLPIIQRINGNHFSVEDYKLLLLNLRQQVIDGASWITRAASNITPAYAEFRQVFIGHAREEQLDYKMLESNYVSVGGELKDIVVGEKNIGSEALSAWMFQRASRENPFDLLGAMFIIEGLGNKMAGNWGKKIMKQLNLLPQQVSFLLYHSENDENHIAKMEKMLKSELIDEKLAKQIVKTAKVTARLYLLQLEELGNY